MPQKLKILPRLKTPRLIFHHLSVLCFHLTSQDLLKNREQTRLWKSSLMPPFLKQLSQLRLKHTIWVILNQMPRATLIKSKTKVDLRETKLSPPQVLNPCKPRKHLKNRMFQKHLSSNLNQLFWGKKRREIFHMKIKFHLEACSPQTSYHHLEVWTQWRNLKLTLCRIKQANLQCLGLLPLKCLRTPYQTLVLRPINQIV